jgi:hypothetical protein
MLCSETGVESHGLELFAPPLLFVEWFDGISKPIPSRLRQICAGTQGDIKPVMRRRQQKSGLNRLAIAC